MRFSVDNLVDIGAYSGIYPRSSVLEGPAGRFMLVGAPYGDARALPRPPAGGPTRTRRPSGAYRGVGQPIACAGDRGSWSTQAGGRN